MKTYNPNTHWAYQTVEITYQQWDYKTTVILRTQGNCKGYSVIACAISQHAQEIYEKQGDGAELVLSRPASDGDGEDTLETTPDGEDYGGWLEEMCVGVRIIDVFEFKRGDAQ